MISRLSATVWSVVLVTACAGGDQTARSEHTTEPRSILGTTWQWEETITPVEKVAVPGPERYTILFQDDGTARIQFDCNRGSGSYTFADGQLTFGPLVSTRMACPPDSMDAPFMRDLQRVASFFVQDGKLYLELPFDSGTMRFRPAP